MEWLAREVARLARQLQRDLEELHECYIDSNGSKEPAGSTARRLERIERELGAVHEDTSELISRVPRDLAKILTELKLGLLDRLHGVNMANRPTRSPSAESANQANDPHESPQVLVESLTPQERRVFRFCFESGFLTYQEIASHLDITSGAAKNLVNRIFQSDRKRPLFAKRYSHGSARVGIRPGLEKQILSGRDRPRGEHGFSTSRLGD